MRATRRFATSNLLRATFLALASVAFASCHRDPSPRIKLAVIEKCEDGVRRAIKQRSAAKVQRIYHESCASVFLETACRDAFFKAGRAPLDRQDAIALDGCRKSYCPLLAPSTLEACSPDFRATPDTVQRAWQPLQMAIIRYDARGYYYRMEQTLLGLYAVLHGREVDAEAARKREAEAAAAAASASASAPTGTEPPGSGQATPERSTPP